MSSICWTERTSNLECLRRAIADAFLAIEPGQGLHLVMWPETPGRIAWATGRLAELASLRLPPASEVRVSRVFVKRSDADVINEQELVAWISAS